MAAFIDEPHVLDLMGDREMLTAERCEELMKSAEGREGEITKVRVFATTALFAWLISLCSSVPTVPGRLASALLVHSSYRVRLPWPCFPCIASSLMSRISARRAPAPAHRRPNLSL